MGENLKKNEFGRTTVFEDREPYRHNFVAVRFAIPHQNCFGV